MRLASIGRGALALLLLTGTACRDAGSDRGGTVVVATASDADNLLPPFSRTTQSRVVIDALFDKLADLGPTLNTLGDQGFQPRLAQRWEWSRDSLSVTFHLDPRARWHDGHPVRAGDVRFAFAVYTDSLVHAPGGGDLTSAVDSISVGDSLTCTAWFHQRSPEQFFTLVFTLVPLPEHLLGKIPRDSLMTTAFTRHPIGNGPFRFVTWVPRQRIEIAAVDSFYRGRPILDRVIWTIAPEMATAVQKLFAGEADFLEVLSPGDVSESAKHPGVRVVPYGSFDYNFMQLNLRDGTSAQAHPLFGDHAVRRALTLALDRQAMVHSVLDSLGRVGLGPFVRAQWAADTTITQIPFDRAAALRILDSLGWRPGPDGIRVRNGRPLAFTLLVPSSSKNRGRFAVLIQEQLRQAGVRVDIESLDFNALGARVMAHKFDAFMGGLHPSPSPSGIRQSWASARPGAANGFNYGGYLNPVFDAQVDSALSATDVTAARRHFRVAYQTIVDDAPAIWLYEPIAVAGVSTRLKTGTLPPHAWWKSLSDWSVTSGGRTPPAATPTP